MNLRQKLATARRIGLRAAAGMVLRGLRGTVYVDETLVVFAIRPEELNPATPALTSERWSARSVPAASFPHAERLPDRVRRELSRAPAGQRIHWIDVDGHPASWGLSTTWTGPWALTETKSSLNVAEGEVCLTGFETLPDHRGHRLYQSVITAMLQERFGEGARRAYIWCRRGNHPSYRAITRVGFRAVAVHRYRRLFGIARRAEEPFARRRVAHVMPWPSVGGTEHAQARLASAAEGDEFTSVAFCLRNAAPVRSLFEAAGVPVVEYDAEEPSIRRPARYLRASIDLAQSLRRAKVDLVHFADLIAAHRCSLGALLAGVPSITQVRNAFPERVSFRDGLFLRPLRRFVFVSEDARRVFGYQVSLQRSTVLYDGIQPPDVVPGEREVARAEFGIAPSQRVIGMVARVAEQKDYPTLVRAASTVVKRHPEARFMIVGQHSGVPTYADHYALVRRMIDERGLGAHFIFTDHRDDVTRLISAMDLCVLSTHQEGLPLVILEAMAQEKPFVATRVGGIPEVVRDGDTGLLVPHGDADALATALLSLLDDPSLAARLAERAKALVRGEFSLASFRQRSRALYRSLLAG
jgi:glycosyltransferase involved in cell wall biosynthesis